MDRSKQSSGRCIAAAALGAALLAGTAAAQPSIIALGTLPGGNNISRAYAVSADGTAVFGASISAGLADVPFRWTPRTGMQFLTESEGTFDSTFQTAAPSGAFAAGNAATIGAPGRQGVVWSELHGMVAVGHLPGGSDDTSMTTVTDQGVGYGWSSTETSAGDFRRRAVRWSMSDGLTTVPLPAGDETEVWSGAWGELDDGRVYGWSLSGGWFYTPGQGHELIPGTRHMAFHNDDGSFLAGSVIDPDTLGSRPAYWTRERGIQLLPVAELFEANQIRGMSDDGSIIIGVEGPEQVVWVDQGPSVPVEAFLEANGVDLTGWTILRISDISADGRTLVGEGRHESWFVPGEVRTEALVITIPAPGAAMLAAASLLLAARRRSSEKR